MKKPANHFPKWAIAYVRGDQVTLSTQVSHLRSELVKQIEKDWRMPWTQVRKKYPHYQIVKITSVTVEMKKARTA